MVDSIELKDLVKEYVQPKGKYAGSYEVYFNDKVFTKLTGLTPKIWGKDNTIEAGDWVVALDGYVVQCMIAFYPFINNKKDPAAARRTKRFRFPMGTMEYYKGKRGEHYSNFYAGFTFPRKGAVGGKPAKSKKDMGTFPDQLDKSNKKLFGTFVGKGIHPYNAYVALFGTKRNFASHITKRRLNFAVVQLLGDKTVKDAISESASDLLPFFSTVNKKIPDDTIADEIVSLLKESDKGSKNHRENIQWVMKIKGLEVRGDNTPPNERDKINGAEEAEEVPFEETPPPQLED